MFICFIHKGKVGGCCMQRNIPLFQIPVFVFEIVHKALKRCTIQQNYNKVRVGMSSPVP